MLCGLLAVVLMVLCVAPSLAGQEKQNPPNVREVLPRKRNEWFYRQRAYPLGYIPAGARLRAIKELDKMLEDEGRSRKGSEHPTIPIPATQWNLIGPRPVKFANDEYRKWSGRVDALAVDPRDYNVVYLGAAEGGVWKTTDGGSTWKALTDAQPSLAVGSIALDPSNPDIVYVGTGDPHDSGYEGAGILKSIDGGVTWVQMGADVFTGPFNSEQAGASIGFIAVNPANSQVLLAAVGNGGLNAGIWLSKDGGATWTKVLSVEGGASSFLCKRPHFSKLPSLVD
jgi:hypothetical protein